ncbi:MAG: hypothetical protein ACJA13_002928 [Paraglaciecola sp.]|jgi:hypothetical protein
MQEQEPSFLINPNIKAEIIHIGIEQTPIIIIDDLAVDNKDVINYACTTSKFADDLATFYPGVRAPLPQPYVITVLQAVYLGICNVYKVPIELNLVPLNHSYSLLTNSEKELHFLQRMPHFDTSKPYHFAVLHYLNSGSHGNTGFFRHIPTGYERITDSRSDHYANSAKAFLVENGEPIQKYVTRSDKHYELYHEVEYKPNRLVIYPGNLLHSTIVIPETDLSGDPKTGRLTANMFIDFQ